MPTDDHVQDAEEEVENEEEDEEVEEVVCDDLFTSELSRRNGGLHLYIEMSDEMEEFLSGSKVSESSNWSSEEEQHRFYHIDGLDEEIKEYLEDNYPSSSDYGEEYIQNGEVNMSVLRTVGLSEGAEFELDETHPESVLVKAQIDLRDAVVDLYKTFVRPLQVNATIEVKQVL